MSSIPTSPEGRALTPRHAPLGRCRGRVVRRVRRDPRGAVHLGRCDTHPRPRARPRTTRRPTWTLAPPAPVAMRSGWDVGEPQQRPVLLVNPRSGGGKAARVGLIERARERGIGVIVLRPGDSLPALVDQAVADGADVLGVAGGDGSLAVVAA